MPKLEVRTREFDIFERAISTATSKRTFWYTVSLVAPKMSSQSTKTLWIHVFFLVFLVDFSGFLRISYFPNTKCLVLRSLIMKNIVPNNIEEMSGNSIGLGTPRKHPGNTRERCIYQLF